MPMHENLPVTVTLVVAVDGHRLEFPVTVEATGARYHGRRPPDAFANAVLEHAIRAEAGLALTKVTDAAAELLARMYPYAGEPGGARS